MKEVRDWELVPLNLKKIYGEKYKINLDESAHCPGESTKDPWYFQIPSKYGHFYPYSDEMLGFYCESGRVRGRLHRQHPEIEVRNWSDDGEAIFLFRPEQFNLVVKYAQPKRRKRLSEEHKAKLANSNRGFRFKAKNHACESSLTENCGAILREGSPRVSEHG